MSCAVMLSIGPRWTALIAGGAKTREVRKSRPTLPTPFRCFIYETKGRTDTPWADEDGHLIFHGRGQVIGEFVCDRIDRLSPGGIPYESTVREACMTLKQFSDYRQFGAVCFWHISELMIYDTPRELREFTVDGVTRMELPPQSWCYVREFAA